jgi:hypothetical protein
MTATVKPVTGAIRKVVTPDGRVIKSIDELEDGGSLLFHYSLANLSYIAASSPRLHFLSVLVAAHRR